MSTVLPIIDLGPFTIPDYQQSTKQDVIEALAHANSTLGCFYLKNHGVDKELIKTLISDLRIFFSQPSRYKSRFIDPRGNPNRGYLGLEKQNVHASMGILGKPGDPLEKYLVMPVKSDVTTVDENLWPDKPDTFKNSVSNYYIALKKLSHILMRVFSSALNLPGYEDFFYEKLGVGEHRLKMHIYPPDVSKKPDQDDRLAAHTDFAPFAILITDACTGALQMWNDNEKKWVRVEPMENTFVVNLGEPMVHWTNARWVAPLHKVGWPEKPSEIGRISVVYFPHADPNLILDTIPQCVPQGEKPKFKLISYRDFANLKIANSY